MDSSYAEVGTEVILRKGKSWVQGMEKFTGQKAIITQCWHEYCRVNIDNGNYWWCIQAMYLASDEPLLRK